MRASGNILLKLIVGCLLATMLVPSASGIIYPKSSAPNGYKYYPIPKDTVGVSMFLADVYKYYEAKQLRNDSIKIQLQKRNFCIHYFAGQRFQSILLFRSFKNKFFMFFIETLSFISFKYKEH